MTTPHPHCRLRPFGSCIPHTFPTLVKKLAGRPIRQNSRRYPVLLYPLDVFLRRNPQPPLKLPKVHTRHSPNSHAHIPAIPQEKFYITHPPHTTAAVDKAKGSLEEELASARKRRAEKKTINDLAAAIEVTLDRGSGWDKWRNGCCGGDGGAERERRKERQWLQRRKRRRSGNGQGAERYLHSKVWKRWRIWNLFSRFKVSAILPISILSIRSTTS